MSQGYGDDEEDMFDDTGEDDDESEETEISAESSPPRPAVNGSPGHRGNGAGSSKPASGIQRRNRLRVRNMTSRMLTTHPNVVSIALTHGDGRQVIFVRK